MRLSILIIFTVFAASPLFAQGVIKNLQKRIKKDRKDILFYLTRIKDEEAQLKKDRAKAAKYSDQANAGPVPDGQTPIAAPTDKWSARVAKDNAAIESDRALQEKAQKDLAKANAQLSNILSKH